MERMNKGDLLHIGTAYVEVHTFKGKDYVTVRDFSTTTNALSKEVLELEEENKNLNKHLGEKIDTIQVLIREKYEEKGEKLELFKENKKLKKERDLYKARNEELNENCFGLSKENKKLKSDLSECECSFGFESDEVGFWKREYKRLKKWIKDHCKGYGNLFPEDEMKRQWKKADKKRKKTKEDDELIYEEGLYD